MRFRLRFSIGDQGVWDLSSGFEKVRKTLFILRGRKDLDGVIRLSIWRMIPVGRWRNSSERV